MKDALGKVARILWASRMGRKFDSDPKRWRYRGTLLYALGNALEIVTFVFPNLFLLFATGGNTLKQVSMLTSSSTRNTIYNSFKVRRGGGTGVVSKGGGRRSSKLSGQSVRVLEC